MGLAAEITAVGSRRDLKEFIDLPYRLHGASDVWIPPLKLDQRMLLSRRFNPFFKSGEAEFFLARRGKRVVGRISAHIDHKFSDHQGNEWGWFGFLDVEEDPEAASALLDAAAAWLRERGRDRMIGPASFTMNDESGLVVGGFEREPCIRQPWNPPYYQRMLEGRGMRKVVDLLTFEVALEDRVEALDVLWDLAGRLEQDHGIVVRRMSRLHLRRDLEAFAEVYNEAWKDNFGFRPYDSDDLDAFAQEMQLVFDKHWFLIAERKDTGEPVAVNISVPDVNQILKPMKGRLFPTGLHRYLLKQRYMSRLRIGFLGVKPGYQHTGVAAKLYQVHFDTSDRPQRVAEGGWILETNTAMRRGIEMVGGRLIKTYRIYEELLADGAEPAAAEPAGDVPALEP